MKSNESTVTWTTAFFIGLGAFLGFLGIATVKALGLGMTFSNSITSSLPEALGRMACVMAVFGLYCFATRNKKKHNG